MPRPAAQRRPLAALPLSRSLWSSAGRAAVVAALLASGGPRASAELAAACADSAGGAESSLLQLAGRLRKDAHQSTVQPEFENPANAASETEHTRGVGVDGVDIPLAVDDVAALGRITEPLDSNVQVPQAPRVADSGASLGGGVVEGAGVVDVTLNSEMQMPTSTQGAASAVDAGSNDSSGGTITVSLDANLQVPRATYKAGSADRSEKSGMGVAGVADVTLNSEPQMPTTTQGAASAVDTGSNDSSGGTIAVPLGSNLQVPRAIHKAGSADRSEGAGVVGFALNSRRAAVAAPPGPGAAQGLAEDLRDDLDYHSLLQVLAGRAGGGGAAAGGPGRRSLLQAVAGRAAGRGAAVGGGAALGLGALYGLMHILGPDHIGTLITLSATAAPARAFTIGAYWSCGHCLGMVVVGGAFLLADALAGGSVEAWESYGNYFIGVSMIAVALYFAFTESSRLEVHADGVSTLKSCDCCEPAAAEAASAESADFRCVPCPASPSLSPRVALPHAHPAEPGPSQRGAEGALVGLLQGICCPTGLLGIAFLAEMSAWGVVIFTAAFVFVSVLGTGVLAACWGHLTRGCCGGHVSHVALYRASYSFTLLLGVAWIVATYSGLLSKLDFTDSVVMMQALLQT